ncbi:GntR family transcriptional regulator [Streptomyces werraensis]|uniref:GntR family transcriptional regulator n=1 Tax=Streptomyces werraensis TaxID=68284 RepID=UPI00382198D0
MQNATAMGSLPETINLPGNEPRADELYQYLRKAIVRGDLPSGTRIKEEDLARRAKVSRTPVIRALRRLEATGLLRESHKGLHVSDLSADELADVCEVRDGLEALAARKAAATRTELDLAVLEELTHRFEAALEGDVSEIVDLNHRFHDGVWEAARNTYLRDNLQQTRDLIERLDSTTLSSSVRQHEALEEHRAILAAIAARDADQAYELTMRHFKAATALRVLSRREQARRHLGDG